MSLKPLLLIGLCILAAVLLIMARRPALPTSHARLDSGTYSNRAYTEADAETTAWRRMLERQISEAKLRKLSTNNPAFQRWGRDFMLKAVNEHLNRVPLFGLGNGPLNDENVLVTTFLTQNGADISLATKDLKHCLYYEHGVLYRAVALDADLTGSFRDPSKIEHFTDYAGVWSDVEAKRAAEAFLSAMGLDPKSAGASRGPSVRPETLNLPSSDGKVIPVTVFYTVRWPADDDPSSDIIEIRFRRDQSGAWQPTEWFNDIRNTTDAESTSYTNLYLRFFTNSPMKEVSH